MMTAQSYTRRRPGQALVAFGLILTVIPTAWTPFGAKFSVPKVGCSGVFKVASAFDAIAAVLAFFVLRKMKAPVLKGGGTTTTVAAA
jgi:hypothetical protein